MIRAYEVRIESSEVVDFQRVLDAIYQIRGVTEIVASDQERFKRLTNMLRKTLDEAEWAPFRMDSLEQTNEHS